MINVSELRKNYGQFEAVKGISFKVSSGEVVGFLGPNGAGKTTTMRILTGFLGPSSGNIEIDGLPLAQNLEHAKSMIGYLPENNPLYEDMMVREYLDFIAEMRGIESGIRAERVQRNIDLYGLKEVSTRDIGELSKGYRQRVGLAQASLHDPPIMILDEPTSGLDPNQIIEIRNLIKEIGKTKTVILSTHNLSEVEATCNRVIIIKRGELVADQTPEALESEGPKAILGVRLKAEGPVADILGQINGVSEIKESETIEGWRTLELMISQDAVGGDIGEKVFDEAVRNGWKLSELKTEQVSLEEIFTQLTKEK